MIYSVSDILGNPIVNPVNHSEFKTMEEAIENIPKTNLSTGQHVVISKETNDQGMVAQARIVHIT